jgi:hypothetical protein
VLFRQVWLKHQALQVAGAVTAPISGIVQRWLKTSGETVSEGETLAVMEAMKMEVPVLAARNGVLSIQIAAGESCQQDGVLGKVTPDPGVNSLWLQPRICALRQKCVVARITGTLPVVVIEVYVYEKNSAGNIRYQ